MTENANQGKGRRLQWFRFYSDVVNDPKVQRLSPPLFKTWVNLLCLAAERDGQLPSIDDMAFQLRLSVHEAQQQIDDLILAGLVDIQPDKSLSPHNWNLRQFKSDTSADRTRKYRENKKEKPCDVTVTADVTRPEQRQSRNRAETESTPLPPEGACEDQAEPVILEGGNLKLNNKLWITWLEIFGNDKIRLLLALREVGGRIQPNSTRPLEAQVSSQLARIAGDKRDRDSRYESAVKTNGSAAPAQRPKNQPVNGGVAAELARLYGPEALAS